MTESPVDKGPPSKECPRARAFEEHGPHDWHKETRPEWKFWCDGILPEDEQPPCQVYVSPEKPECGLPAPTTIHVKTRLIDARVDVCKLHKAQYDSRSAELRSRRFSLPKAS